MTKKHRRFDPRLHLMFFMQYAVYGIWVPLAGRFLTAPTAEGGLGFDDHQKSLIVALAAGIGALCAPFLAGQIADRYFATEKCLGALLMIGGVVKFVTAYQTSYAAWLWLSIAYAVLFMPTQALVNSQCMAHLDDPKRKFPGVRVWGTIGWIAVAWLFPAMWLQTNVSLSWLPPFVSGAARPDVIHRMIDALKFAGVMSFGYGLYCWFCLPHTPPNRDGVAKVAFVKAFALIRYRSFAVLLVVAMMASILHTMAMMETGKFLPTVGLDDSYIMQAFSLGPITEILALGFLGVILTRLGFRTVLTLGCLFFFLRCVIFGFTNLPLPIILCGVALHGFCFAFFVATSFIYVNRIAPEDIRNSAQTVFMLIFFGVGPLLTGLLSGRLSQFCTVDGVVDYGPFWHILAGIGLAATVLVALVFRDQTEEEGTE